MTSPRRFYTYAYLREDKTPYYIGKGSRYRYSNRSKNDIKPPKDKSRIIFLKKNLTEDEAFKHEKYMISLFGRKDLKTGILHNKTDGGEGNSNFSKLRRENISKVHKGKKLSNETKNKISESRKKANIKVRDDLKKLYSIKYSGEGNPNYGKKHSKETLKKISEGTKNKNLKTRTYISPLGEMVKVENLRVFCEENNLIYNSMISLHNEKMISHKGYTKFNPSKGLKNYTNSPENLLDYKYILTSPEGIVYEVTNLKEFCLIQHLNDKKIRAVCRGRSNHHKGWRAYREIAST